MCTEKQTKPPFRADHVGSLLRTAALKEARDQHAKGAMSAAALTEVEDREIRGIIRRQEDAGLQGVTDGESGGRTGISIFWSNSTASSPSAVTPA
jgi:methionine synthase II (cobalamin-independent)